MKELRIAVLGAGNIGGTLGRKWVAAGHKVSFGVTNPDSARAQALRAALGTKVTIGSVADARVFRAFNTLGWENFADPVFDGIQADLFYCGPDGDAREVVEQMISDVGLRPIRLGDVDQVGLVDSVGSLWFALALGQGKGRHMAFKVLSR